MNEKIMIWPETKNIASYIRPYLLDTVQPRGAVLILPGGGYNIVCEPSEGEPVAKKFNSLGFHAFVLSYRTAPNVFPAAQSDAMRALRFIRGNAKKWRIKENVTGVCGFSAGGHLAASLGCSMVDDVPSSGGDEFDAYSPRPDFIIAGQGVVSFCEKSHAATAINLLGKKEPSAEELAKVSPDLTVTADTPPTFLWHTFGDKVVNFNCSIALARALQKHGVPCQLQIFPRGDHGILLGVNTPDVSQWPALAAAFITEYVDGGNTPQEHYTHAYQCQATGTYPGKLREE